MCYIYRFTSINKCYTFHYKIYKKEDFNFKNINYNISIFSYFNILTASIIIGLFFAIDYYNGFNNNKMLELHKEIVIDYLNKEYPNYDFEITDTYEEEVGYCLFGCRTTIIKNDIVNKAINKNFSINVKKEDLTISDDDFKYIFEEQQQKENDESKKLSYTISYNGINCLTPTLYLYNDNTYKYYYTFSTDNKKIVPKTGTYNYDITKIINSIEKYEENSFEPYLTKEENEKTIQPIIQILNYKNF